MNRFLCHARIFHQRMKPRVNAFTYRAAYLCFPLSQLRALESAFLSLERFNLFSFYNRDHGALDGSALEPWMRGILAQHGITRADGDVMLMCHPRMLGFVFNPVSFWFCLDKEGALRAVLAEVNNTFGERHCYLVAHPDARVIEPSDVLTARKLFHVSPFMAIEGEYHFRFHVSDDKITVTLDLVHEGETRLFTWVKAKRRALSSTALLGVCLVYPLMTLMVPVKIHWQALKLWLKRAVFHKKPEPPSEYISR